MDIPETITRVFTKYDTTPQRIDVPIPLNDFESPDISIHNCWITASYQPTAIEQGLEGVVFVHFQRIHEGGFIGESIGTFVDCKVSGEVNFG